MSTQKANSRRPHVVLNMIVKDETAVIERCLAAVLPYIDAWCIVDTGSSDDTKEKILAALDSVPGELHELPWKGMAGSRNDAISLANKMHYKCPACDGVGYFPEGANGTTDCEQCYSHGFLNKRADRYLLFVDADDTFTVESDFEMPELDKEAYQVRFKLGNLGWKRPTLVRADLPWAYSQSAHETLGCGGRRYTQGLLQGAKIVCGRGHRRTTQKPEDKYGKVVELLQEDLEKNPNNLRAMFYLAQSYRDAKDPASAAVWYLKRARAGGWVEEQWYSRLQLGDLYTALGHPFEEIEEQYMLAYTLCPHRAEPLVRMSVLLRGRDEHAKAHLYACAARDLEYPEDDQLFVADDVYEWRALDEYAVTAYHIGKLDQAHTANLELLEKVPDREKPRIETNIAYCSSESPEADIPLPLPVAEAQKVELQWILPLHAKYTSGCSPAVQAPSAKLCALAYVFFKDLHLSLLTKDKSTRLGDLGAGFPTIVLLTAKKKGLLLDPDDAQVLSVALNPESFARHQSFAEFIEVPSPEPLFAEGFKLLETKPSYDVAIMKLGRTLAEPSRLGIMQECWDQLSVGGFMFFDDMHQQLYRGGVQAFLTSVAHSRIECRKETEDEFGRYSWLARKD